MQKKCRELCQEFRSLMYDHITSTHHYKVAHKIRQGYTEILHLSLLSPLVHFKYFSTVHRLRRPNQRIRRKKKGERKNASNNNQQWLDGMTECVDFRIVKNHLFYLKNFYLPWSHWQKSATIVIMNKIVIETAKCLFWKFLMDILILFLSLFFLSHILKDHIEIEIFLFHTIMIFIQYFLHFI